MRNIFLIAFILVCYSCECSTTLLKPPYIRKTMEELFQYHLYQKKLNDTLVKDALYNYIDSFDANKEYLTELEVDDYINPSPLLIQQVSNEFYQDSINTFTGIHRLIIKSIQRHRNLRAEMLHHNIHELFEKAANDKDKNENKITFPDNQNDIKDRLHHNLMIFIKFEINKLGHAPNIEEQQLILNLFDNQKRDHEKLFLANEEEIEQTVVTRTLKAYATSLDAHTAYFTADEAHRMRAELNPTELSGNRLRYDYEGYGDGVIGTIQLTSFYENQSGKISSENDIKKALAELNKHGDLKGLILDLRENYGGFLMQGVKVAGLFITNGVVAVAQYSDNKKQYFRDTDENIYYDGPIIILTSRKTASAAEIVAQTLQDYGVAIIVGDETTYGKGSIQYQTFTDNDEKEAFFKVTVGRYYTVSGNSTQIDGVRADIIVNGPYSQEKIGERFLKQTLSGDKISPSFIDTLEDVQNKAKAWYWNYYNPTLQHKENKWRMLIPVLKANSEYRIKNSTNYQLYLNSIKDKQFNKNFGSEDLQLNEVKNIVKDMILLSLDDVPAQNNKYVK